MRNRMRVAAMAAATLGLVAVGAPAQAASGGGCRDTSVIGACISYRSGHVYGDFYLNGPPDRSRCWAVLEIYRNGNAKPIKKREYKLDRQGRYGPISASVASLPAKKGSAYTKVRVLTCSKGGHFEADSPRVYFP